MIQLSLMGREEETVQSNYPFFVFLKANKTVHLYLLASTTSSMILVKIPFTLTYDTIMSLLN